MLLQKLTIEMQASYEECPGKYKTKVEFDSKGGDITFHLDAQVSEQLLSWIGPIITKVSHEAALRLEDQIKLSVAAAKQLPAIEQEAE